MSLLLPDGITKLADLPWPLWEAVRFALQVLGWEELPSEDQPPRSIWLEHKDLRDWFKDVRRRWKERASGKSEEIEGPTEQNALVKEWFK